MRDFLARCKRIFRLRTAKSRCSVGFMKAVAEIINSIGRNRIEAAFGLSRRRVDEWVQFNMIPSLYFHGLERMAGQPLPRNLFSFKDAAE